MEYSYLRSKLQKSGKSHWLYLDTGEFPLQTDPDKAGIHVHHAMPDDGKRISAIYSAHGAWMCSGTSMISLFSVPSPSYEVRGPNKQCAIGPKSLAFLKDLGHRIFQ